MRQVFIGSNNLEAHVISHLLEAEGIKTTINGEYLSGGRGGLVAQDQAQVWILLDDDYERAKEIILELEKDKT